MLRAHLEALNAWTSNDAFIGWKAARLAEAQIHYDRCRISARNWDEIIDSRARAEETILIAEQSHEDARQTLEERINQAVEEETQLAATGNV